MLLLPLTLALAVGCPHDASLGKVSFVRTSRQHVVSLADCADRVVGRAGAPGAPMPVRGVVVRDRALWLRTPRGLLRLTRPLPHRDGLTQTPVPVTLSPDGRWIVWVAGINSGSLSSDGRPLSVTRLARGGPTRLLAGSMLEYRDYLSWCGSALVYTAGFDRIATDTKRLLVARPPDWRPRPLWADPARAFGSVACAPGGRSVAVLSQRASDDANFFHTRWQLWRIGLDGSRTLLDTPPSGRADESPRWGPRGALFFVRERRGVGRLMVRLRSGRIYGPVVSLGYSLGYYGHHDWPYAPGT
jgi:hypothetical protein